MLCQELNTIEAEGLEFGMADAGGAVVVLPPPGQREAAGGGGGAPDQVQMYENPNPRPKPPPRRQAVPPQGSQDGL